MTSNLRYFDPEGPGKNTGGGEDPERHAMICVSSPSAGSSQVTACRMRNLMKKIHIATCLQDRFPQQVGFEVALGGCR
jgi:hypothetical protein